MKADELLSATKLLLGDGIVKVELTEAHKVNALDIAATTFELYSEHIKSAAAKGIKDNWIKLYSMALMKETVAHIRGKYSEVPIPGGNVKTDAGQLLSSAENEKDRLLRMIEDMQ